MMSGQVSKGTGYWTSTSNPSFAKVVSQVETQQDLVAAEVIGDMPVVFPRIWNDIISRFTKYNKDDRCHIEHLLQVNKMVFTDSI